MDKLITAKDIAKRDHMISVDAWIRDTTGKLKKRGMLAVMWDGKTVEGEPVAAFVNHGRLLAQCDICQRLEYVCEERRIFYCSGCGNGGKESARPVSFPDDWEAVKAALLARPVLETIGRNPVERMFFHKPGVRGLQREWQPGTDAAVLEVENRGAMVPKRKRSKKQEVSGE